MSQQFVGEVRMFGFAFVPRSWLPCDGSLRLISEFDVLFTLIGTTYGGDGVTTFALPDMRGRLPIHQGQAPGGSNFVLGQRSGTETVTLTAGQMPMHTHFVSVTGAAATTGTPGNTVAPGTVSDQTMYVTDTSGGTPFTMAPQSCSVAGGSQPHENCMPTLTIQFCIAAEGIFPPQN